MSAAKRKLKAKPMLEESEESVVKGKKKPPFSPAAIQCILDEYLEKKALFQNENNTVTNRRAQKGAWEQIAAKLNALDPLVVRTGDDVRKKFNNMTTLAKSNAAQRKASQRETGGGPPLDGEVEFWEIFLLEKILSKAIVDGLDGGYESEQKTAAEVLVEGGDQHSTAEDDDEDEIAPLLAPAAIHGGLGIYFLISIRITAFNLAYMNCWLNFILPLDPY